MGVRATAAANGGAARRPRGAHWRPSPGGMGAAVAGEGNRRNSARRGRGLLVVKPGGERAGHGVLSQSGGQGRDRRANSAVGGGHSRKRLGENRREPVLREFGRQVRIGGAGQSPHGRAILAALSRMILGFVNLPGAAAARILVELPSAGAPR